MRLLYHTCASKSRRKPCISSATCCGELLVKYSAPAECEIMCYRTLWNIAPSSQCEMKFAHSHLRSKYFTAKLFHMAKPYFTGRRRISLKKAHIVLVDKCVLFSGGEREIRTLGRVLAYTRFPVVRLRPTQPSLRGLEYYTTAFRKNQAFFEK